MGMFDSVMVNCPKCGHEHEFQSKSGECILDVYTLDDCPNNVMVDVNRHSPYKCDCGIQFMVNVPRRAAVSLVSSCCKSNFKTNWIPKKFTAEAQYVCDECSQVCDFIESESEKEEVRKVTNKNTKKRYIYKGNPYVIFQETKMKVDGEWIDCVIYQTLYDNPDGEFWVRSSEEFFALFQEVRQSL